MWLHAFKTLACKRGAPGSLIQWSAPGGAASFAGSDELAEGVPEQSHQGAVSFRVCPVERFGCVPDREVAQSNLTSRSVLCAMLPCYVQASWAVVYLFLRCCVLVDRAVVMPNKKKEKKHSDNNSIYNGQPANLMGLALFVHGKYMQFNSIRHHTVSDSQQAFHCIVQHCKQGVMGHAPSMTSRYMLANPC